MAASGEEMSADTVAPVLPVQRGAQPRELRALRLEHVRSHAADVARGARGVAPLGAPAAANPLVDGEVREGRVAGADGALRLRRAVGAAVCGYQHFLILQFVHALLRVHGA